MPDGALPVLDVRDLKTVFQTRGGEVHAVNDVSFSLRPGELLGVVGESGSGKSVTMMSLLGLLPSPPAEVRNGTVMFDGKNLLDVSQETLRSVRGGKIGFVFQDPMTSLNPVYQVGFQIMEPLRKHMGMTKAEADNLFDAFGTSLRSNPSFRGGAGLGLSIANSIAHLMDGKIEVESEPHVGSTFTISCRVGDVPEELMNPQPPQYRNVPVNPTNNKRLENLEVLVVDDVEMNRIVVRKFLELEGAIVAEAVNGLDAVEGHRNLGRCGE